MIEIIIFWVVMTCRIVSGHQRFRETYCLHVLNPKAHNHENLRTCNYLINKFMLKCVLFNFVVTPNCNIEVEESKAAFINHFNV
jgi:predicted ferric reductase